MLTGLFWNLNRRDLVDHVASLVEEHRVDVLVLAESPHAANELRARLRGAGLDFVVPRQADRCMVTST